ncbi:MAG: hypothetical protein WC091_04605 [Sulfuricellaceae bacterium]
MAQNTYFSGQGVVYLAERDSSGNPLAFEDARNAPAFKFSLKTETLEHKESRSGQRLVDLRLIKGKSAECSMTLDVFDKARLALVLYGAHSTLAAGSVTDEAMPAGMLVGQFYGTAKPVISSVVIKDSAATPATLAHNKDYRVTSPGGGMIEILNVGTFVQPFKVSYVNGDATNINMMTAGAPERWVRFVGVNTAANNANVIIDLYRVSFDPLKDLNLISDDIAKFELAGSVLMDDTKENDAVLGQFGRIVQV